MKACLGCGTPSADEDPTPTNCPNCPPETCKVCGGVNDWGSASYCSCWVSVEDLPLADVKALFAHDGTFNVGIDGTLSASEPTSSSTSTGEARG